jgi:DNA-binding transcriptional ArsR family regulator
MKGRRAGTTPRRPATRAEARALAHPLRLRILRLCLDESHTNRELATLLDEQPATTLYHVRTLARTGFLVAEAERRGRRGAREIPYRATRKSWDLDLPSGPRTHTAPVDAFRAELAQAGPESVLTSIRLGVRLTPDALEQVLTALGQAAMAAHDADDPSGEAVSLYVGVHRRSSPPRRRGATT